MSLPFFQVKNQVQVFTEADTDGLKLLYKPGMIGTVPLSGYIVDFSVYADIQSIQQLIPNPPNSLQTRAEQASEFYTLAQTHPNVKLQIFLSEDDGVTTFKLFDCLLWNRRPYFFVDLIPRFTRAASILLGQGETGQWGIYGKLSQALAAGDRISIYVAATEEAPNAQIIAPQSFKLPLTNVNTEYSLAIPTGTQKLSFSASDEIKYSWSANSVVASGIVLPPFNQYQQENVFLVDKVLYFSSAFPGAIVTCEVWA